MIGGALTNIQNAAVSVSLLIGTLPLDRKEISMGICPTHGHYDGTCKKCAPNEFHGGKQVVPSAPVIEDCDKFILRSFENDCLNVQIEMQNSQQRLQNALQAFNRHVHVVMEKLSLDPKEWVLDAKNMVFVKRPVNEDSSGNK